ncbi:MAG: serine hydrolase [Planctomycetia bacterium]|nr:MAG: serine hydrolase [Planctomycetia bacterium]
MRTAVLSVAILMLPAAAARADAHRDSTTETGWWYFTSATDAQINAKRGEGYRLIKLGVVDNDPMRFSAVLVHNSGDYFNPADGWWYNLTFTDLEDILDAPGVRALQIVPYLNLNGALRYAVVLISNSGQYAKGWWWAHNVDLAGIQSIGANQNMRLIAWERRPNEVGRFSCVFVSNTGGDQRNWWPYPGISAGTLANLLDQHDARITDLTYIGNNQFDAVLEELEGQRWWYYYGVTASQMSILLGNRGARLYDLQRMSTGAGGSTYAVLMLNNANPLETRISSIMRSIMDNELYVPIGASLKRVNGSYRAALHHQRIFDPASTLKTLHHVHAMRQVSIGNIDFSQLINVNGFTGSPGGCPPEEPDQLEPLDDVLRLMMEQSDNVRTEAIKDRFGQASINATADALLMADTELVRRIGCGGDHNEMTLEDAGRLHEAVVNGYLNGPTGDWRDEFYDLMISSNGAAMGYGGGGGFPDLGGIIDEEAADIGLPDAKRIAFRAAVEMVNKPGGVTLSGLEHKSVFGWISIPYRTGGVLDPREFVTGTFVDGAVSDPNSGAAMAAGASEILRDEIRAALLSWLVPGRLEMTPEAGFETSGFQGGPFAPNGRTYFLSNTGDVHVSWSATDNRTWAHILPNGGVLPPGGQALVTIYHDDPIENLLPGVYTGTATFTNLTNGIGNTTRSMMATVHAIPGDMNCDGMVNNFDIDAFVLALTNPALYARTYPLCDINAADVNDDGMVNNFDIDPFVECVINFGCP